MKRIKRNDDNDINVFKDLNRILFKISKTDDPRQNKVLRNHCAEILMIGVKCGFSVRSMKNIICKFVEPDKVPTEYTDILGKF